MKRSSVVLAALLCGTSGFAQEPLSAIEWLNEASTAAVSPLQNRTMSEPPITSGVSTPPIQVTTLDRPRPDAVGLLPSRATGLPSSLWLNSASDVLERHLSHLSPEPLPAIQALYYTLLLAEADPPLDLATDERFLLARLMALRQFGAVEPALALVEAAGPLPGNLFDQWFDLADRKSVV